MMNLQSKMAVKITKGQICDGTLSKNCHKEYNLYGKFHNCIKKCITIALCRSIYYLIQNSQAAKKVCGPQKGYGEKRCEIQGGGQEMAVMVG